MENRTLQRFEMKYLISEIKAREIAAFIRPFVVPDKHAEQGGDYWIDSVYWDAPDLALYRSSVCGEKNRFKLRVRSYGHTVNGHVLLEIKRRIDQVIRKERLWIETARAENLLRGDTVFTGAPSALASSDVMVFHRFRALAEQLDAVPTASVSYVREAYVTPSADEGVRITFDRKIACLPAPNYARPVTSPDRLPIPVVTRGVVLEIKFTDACPGWAREVIQRFDLQRQSVSKYVLSVDAMRRYGIEAGRFFRGMLVR